MAKDKLDLAIERDYKVVKANEIIQKARYDLGLLEQKTFCYAVSKIKPQDEPNQWYTFTINDYCDVCGINRNDGRTIENVKEALKRLRDKSFWITNVDGDEETVGWLDKAIVSSKSGKVRIRFDETIHEYLYDLFYRKPYTQYSLLCVLPMRSSYSVRLYEILKSYVGLKRRSISFDLEELKQKLTAPYSRFPDFRRKVLEIATKEINQYTDIEISWNPIKKGRRVEQIEFILKERDSMGVLANSLKATKQLDGQLSLFDSPESHIEK